MTVAAFEIDRRHRQIGGVLTGRHRVAEGQRARARAAGVGRGAAVVERQRRRAARDRHRLAQVQRQRHHAARLQVAGAGRDAGARRHHRRHRRRRGVDLQGAGRVGHRAGEIGGIAGAVRDGRRTEIDRRHRQVGGVLPGRHRVAEGQRARSRAACIGRGAAVVERQRRRAARDRHRLAQVQRQRHHAAGRQVAGAGRDAGAGRHHRRHCRRRGVDLQGAGRVGHRAGQIGGIAGAIFDRRRIETDRRHRQVSRVLTGGHRVAEGQRARCPSRPYRSRCRRR